MSVGNRISKEELRNEVRDYLIALREERIQRSIDISNHLRQLRKERIEREQNIRGSLAVTQSMKVKSLADNHREELRTHVKRLKVEVRDMLQQYRAVRTGARTDTGGPAVNAKASVKWSVEDVNELEKLSIPSPEAVAAPSQIIDAPVTSQEYEDTSVEIGDTYSYQSRLNKMVANLGSNESAVDKKLSKKDDNTLIGRIRRLASGDLIKKPDSNRRLVSKKEQKTESWRQVASESIEGEHIADVVKNTAVDSVVPKSSEQAQQAEEPQRIVVAVPAREADKADTVEHELLMIDGIGPSVLKRLERIGICTLQDLASTTQAHLEQSFGEYSKLADLSEWIDQAKLEIKERN